MTVPMPWRWTMARTARLLALALASVLAVGACSSAPSSSGPGPGSSAPAATAPAPGAAAVNGDGSVDGEEAANATSVADCGTPPAASTTPGAAAAVLEATQSFLALLDASQRAAVSGERTPQNLGQWSNLPDDLFDRQGLRVDALDAGQQAAAFGVLRAALSPEGYEQVRQITTGDGVLASTTGSDQGFGATHYWFRILGTPGPSGPWTVQYGGHHLALNITVDGGAMTLAPTFWGAQPSSYTAAGTSAEPLCGETTRAFAMMGALDATQQQQALLDTPVTDLVLGAGRDGRTLAPEGVSAATFTPEQQRLLLDLVGEWIRPLHGEQAAPKLAAVEQNLASTTFAWSGATTIGEPVYYRVQGPTFVIEFAHQQGGGFASGGITHIHAVYREPGSDYVARPGR
ncbi:DUF3500 domain-containing protein [Actinomycetospora flava]|uniref:DUF3500 domain-containing protein n=1 Tax=Actinomycetospora flava TaxID=3129232 RepID=A0ABU8MCZ1_9PSEU